MALSVPDFLVFAGLLGISLGIGVFFAIREKLTKRTNTENFLLAGRSMGVVPVSLSLTLGFMSAILLLSTPADVYMFGTMIWWMMIGFLISCVFAAEIYIPVFRNVGIASAYQYLEMRFNRAMRMTATTMYIMQSVIYIGVVIYGPALALNAVTGFNLWATVISTGFVCILYCTLGGLKAVIWIDVFQSMVIVAGLMAVIIRGSVLMDGFGNIWRMCEEGGRIVFFNFSVDPRERYTVWSLLIGFTIVALSLYGTNQAAIQRYLSCKTDAQAKKASLLNAFNLMTVNSLAVLCGLVAYAYFKDCDPLRMGFVWAPDQIMPYLVVEMLHNYPGVPGLFLASVYAGSLSSISAGINGMTCVIVQDYIKPFTDWTDKTYTYVSKALMVTVGMVCMAMSYLTSLLGKLLLQIAMSMISIIGGPLVGVFTMGMLIPCCNGKGAVSGYFSGFFFTTWIFVGSLFYPPPREFANMLPRSVEGCPTTIAPTFNTTYPHMMTSSFNESLYDITTEIASTNILETTTTLPQADDRPAIANLYAISFTWYAACGFLVSLIVGISVSVATGGHKVTGSIRPALIFPIFDHFIFSWLSKDTRRKLWFGVKHDEKKKDETVESNGKEHVDVEEFENDEKLPLANSDQPVDVESSNV